MTALAPILRDQRKIDADHLKLLGIFHFVLAGLAVLGLGFLGLHWMIMRTVFANPEMWKNQNQNPPPAEFFTLFKWFYLVFGTLILLGAVLNLISALCIRRRKARLFSLIVAGLDVLQFPFGTILAVFTFIVLLRESVVEAYAATSSGDASIPTPSAPPPTAP